MKLYKKYAQQLAQMNDMLKDLESVGYDSETWLESTIHTLRQTWFYHVRLKLKKAYYPSDFQVNEHDIVYFNLGRGYPTELQDGHHCYVYKRVGAKAFVIPLRTKRNINNSPLQYEIETKTNNGIKATSTMMFSEMRSVDLMRVYPNRTCLTCATPRKEIEDKFISLMKGGE